MQKTDGSLFCSLLRTDHNAFSTHHRATTTHIVSYQTALRTKINKKVLDAGISEISMSIPMDKCGIILIRNELDVFQNETKFSRYITIANTIGDRGLD